MATTCTLTQSITGDFEAALSNADDQSYSFSEFQYLMVSAIHEIQEAYETEENSDKVWDILDSLEEQYL